MSGQEFRRPQVLLQTLKISSQEDTCEQDTIIESSQRFLTAINFNQHGVVNKWGPKEPTARVKGSKISQKQNLDSMGDRREARLASELPKDKPLHLAKAFTGTQGRSKQYVTKKQTVIKKGSWQQENYGERKRTRHLPPPKSKQQEMVVPLRNPLPSDRDKKKAISLNHLLNFTLAPRDTDTYGYSLPSIRRRSKGIPTFNKEQFLQANCQFVVKYSGEYSVHLADPDLLVEWDMIEQVRLFCHQIPSCPICLYPPTVAKITRCGHMYCWPCVLHYLSLSDKAWGKCPICFESIYKDDLKSVSTTMSSKQYTVGDTIAMLLMIRKKDGTVVSPKSCPSSKQLLPTIDDKVPTQFYKLLTATPEQVLDHIISVEKAELLAQLKSLSPDEASEKCFIDCCLEELERREKLIVTAKSMYKHARHVDTVMEMYNDKVVDTDDDVMVDSVMTTVSEPISIPPIKDITKDDNFVDGPFEQAFSDDDDEDMDNSLLADSKSSSCGSHSSMESEDIIKDEDSPVASYTESTESAYTYFYQASDGQHLYLHPINAHCLIKEYGGLAAAPLEIKGRIVEMEQLSMNTDTRSKYRYLNHLPVTCRFTLCELDLKPPIVSQDTISQFATQFQKRRQLRQKKKHKENQLKRKAEKAGSAGLSPPPDIRQHVHQISPEKFHNLLSLASSPPLSSHVAGVNTVLNPTALEFIPGQPSHCTPPANATTEKASAPSFAQALSKGEKKSSSDVRFPAVKVTTPPKGIVSLITA